VDFTEWSFKLRQERQKIIGLMIATYNEEENVKLIYKEIKRIFTEALPRYNYSILFIDNNSVDGTRSHLREICASDPNVLCIFNERNYGTNRSPFHGIVNTPGDAVIPLCADFQDPPNLIPKLVKSWEDGARVVLARKKNTTDRFVIAGLRKVYYELISKLHGNADLRNCTGFGLYDREVIQRLKKISDPFPFFRGLIGETSSNYSYVDYDRPERLHGSSKMNFYRLYEEGVVGILNASIVPLRVIGLIGLIASGLSIIFSFVLVLVWTQDVFLYPPGVIPILVSIFFLFGLTAFLIGIVAEYIGAIYQQVLNRERVYESERINFD
jgi:polyisoprenyl-phosphate glycosyltransferase